MFFKKKKAPLSETAELIRIYEKQTNHSPYYQRHRNLEIASPIDFGRLHEEYYGGKSCKQPWVRVSFSVPDSDWSEFQKSSHFQSLVSFLGELQKQEPQSQTNTPEDLQECESYLSQKDLDYYSRYSDILICAGDGQEEMRYRSR